MYKYRTLESPKNSIIPIEMDKKWNFYPDKKHQIWLWLGLALDHESG
jgi:hypothetical protein